MGGLELNVGDSMGYGCVFDAVRQLVYVVSFSAPLHVVRVDVSTNAMARLGQDVALTGEDFGGVAVVSGTNFYVASQTTPGKIVLFDGFALQSSQTFQATTTTTSLLYQIVPLTVTVASRILLPRRAQRHSGAF